jgi:hypothetical protein
MKRMFYFAFFLSFWSCALADNLVFPEKWKQHDLVAGVLSQHYIFITGKGSVGVAYEDALRMLEREDLLSSVQSAYQDLLEEGETAEFEIKQVEPGTYQYVNQKGQTTHIVELMRERQEDGSTELLLYSKGVRGFGSFQSLTHVRVHSDVEAKDQSVWQVEVYAYPENSMSRFFARNLGIARRYFHSKTKEISVLATEICLHLIQSF